MIREILRPNSNNFTISILDKYINQEVEFIMFPLDEQETTQEIKQKNNKSLLVVGIVWIGKKMPIHRGEIS